MMDTTKILTQSDSKSDANADQSKTTASTNLFDEFYDSLKYTALQKPYDGISQAVNHLGGNIRDRQIAEAPQERAAFTKEWAAQTAGAGIATIAGIMLTHKALSSAGRVAAVETQLPRSFGEKIVGRTTAGSLAISGAVYEGLTAKASDPNSFWQQRIGNAAIAGASIYGAAKLHGSLTDLARLNQPIFAKGASSFAERQLIHGGIGFGSGVAGGAFSAEAHSLLKDGKLANTKDLATQSLTGGIMGGAFGLAARPIKTSAFYTRETGLVPGNDSGFSAINKAIDDVIPGPANLPRLVADGADVPAGVASSQQRLDMGQLSKIATQPLELSGGKIIPSRVVDDSLKSKLTPSDRPVHQHVPRVSIIDELKDDVKPGL